MLFWTDKLQKLKTILITTAVLIAAVSLVFSHRLTSNLLEEEKGKMEVWAEAMRSLRAADEQTDVSLAFKVIEGNNTIPVIVTDKHHHIETYRNLTREPSGKDSLAMLNDALARIKNPDRCITISLTPGAATTGEADYIKVYYDESIMVRLLKIYPYAQLGVVSFFIIVALFALLASKKAEQNRVWVGLSRETAHQLGTPISSLMAWSQVLAETYPDDPLLPEMDKDVKRLQLIAERFSKIGSAPELRQEDLCELVARVVAYYDRRTSQKVRFALHRPEYPVMVNLNAPLFEWVIENLCKNAVDAMEGVGAITVSITNVEQGAHIEVSDTGKGMARKHFKAVFKPGFTTKKRGWGLGLSLAKRIVGEYHHGRIYVKDSIPGRGTTFAIDIA